MPAGTAQKITLISTTPPVRVTALRGADPPTITGGFAGWTTVPRPRKVSLTEWKGIDPIALNLPLLFDGFATDTSVELDCARLESLGQPLGSAGTRSEGAIIRVIGAVPHTSGEYDRWVVANIDWTQQPIIYSPNGYRVRQPVIVSLLQYIAPDRLATMPAAERARLAALDKAAQAARDAGVGGAPPAHAKWYTVKEGDTLSSIAASQLGDYRRWTEIADLNNIRDPRRLKVGQVLRLP